MGVTRAGSPLTGGQALGARKKISIPGFLSMAIPAA